MNKIFKRSVACAVAALCGAASVSLAACSSEIKTVYNVIGTEET